MKMGQEFEEVLVEKVGTFSAKKWGKCFHSTINTEMDTKGGTDFVLLGIPVDVTLNFEGKNYMSKIGSLSFDTANIHFGVRYGNGHCKFETPVLVVGFNMNIPRQYLERTIDTLNGKMQEILERGMDLYLDAIDPDDDLAMA